MDVAFFDLEYPAWEGSKARNWSVAPGEHHEVIEIGALIVDPVARRIRTTMSLCVRPTINPVLSDYIMGLTGIGQAQADGGASFGGALDRLLDFVGEAQIIWAYGLDDYIVILPTLVATVLGGRVRSRVDCRTRMQFVAVKGDAVLYEILEAAGCAAYLS